MFDNIGGKIKNLAECMCWLGIIGSVIAAFVLWSNNSYYSPTIGLGIAVLVGGCLVSWIGSFAAYALGELTENSERQIAMLTKLYEEQKIMNERFSQLQQEIDSKNSSKSNNEANSLTYHLPEL